MIEKNNFIDIINSVYDDSRYPVDFIEEYCIMECLSDRQGTETYLVQRKDGGSFVAKCFDKEIYQLHSGSDILSGIHHPGLPRHICKFENEQMLIMVREYVEGVSLFQYVNEHELDEKEILSICIQLCDILSFLHSRQEPIIHRDIKPQNVIVKPDKSVVLIDFDIARIYRKENDTDTYFFGTLAYAPPEQYGFSQTDVRSDIYSLGILLRWILTGSTKENKNIRIYRPLQKIIKKCTAFDPKGRFINARQLKKALLAANPKIQRLHITGILICTLTVVSFLIFGGVKIYQYITFNPFGEGHIPAVMSDEERSMDAISYLDEKFDSNLFCNSEEYATVGFVKQILIEVYGMDENYVYAQPQGEFPGEDSRWFMPWNLGDEQYMDRDYLSYIVVKTYWPDKVADWSSLKNDNGEYPGVRVADAWCEKTGIMTGVVRPKDLTKSQIAIAFANADRVYEAVKERE